MSPDISIYRPDGSLRAVVPVGTGSRRFFRLMDHDYLTLKFSSGAPLMFALGDFVNITVDSDGTQARYELVDINRGDFNTSTGGYDFELRLDAQYYKFKNKLYKFLPDFGSDETSFSYTDNIANHAQMLLSNFRALAKVSGSYLFNGSAAWSVQWDSSVDAVKAVTVSFDSVNIIDAIAAIAEAFECEWWFTGSILHFGRCQHGTPVRLELGKELAAVSRADSSEPVATRIYAYGSDRNIGSTYRKDLVFQVTDRSDNGDFFDRTRPLSPFFFDKALRVPAPNTTRSFPFTASASGNPSVSKAGQLVFFTKEINIGALPYDDFIISFENASKVVRYTNFSGAKPQLRVVVDVTGASQGRPVSFSAENEVYLYAGDVNIIFDIPEVRLPAALYDSLVVRISFVLDFFGAGALQTLSLSVNGNATATRQNPVLTVPQLTIDWLDDNGDISGTTEGVILNPDALDNDSDVIPLRAPASNNSQAAVGKRFKIREIKAAVVPAAYFTSRHVLYSGYYDIVTNSVVHRRLLLPVVDRDGNPLFGYVDARTFDAAEEAVEDVVIFEDVYPSRVSKITGLSRSDEYIDKTDEMDGSVTETRWRAWRFRDDLFGPDNPFDSDLYLIDGKDLEITFQSGMLNGMTFGVIYDPDDGCFEIVRDDNTRLPNEVVKPAIGDEFILAGFNIAMLNDPDVDYIARAEFALLDKARQYVDKLNTDAATYDCTVMCDYADSSLLPVYGSNLAGMAVNLVHPAYFADGRISRVIGYEIPLDLPADNPVLVIGEKAQYSRIGAIEDRLDSLGSITRGDFLVSSGGTGASSNAGGIYVITENDATTPGDHNVFSALRARLEFARKAVAERITRAWAFLSGASFGDSKQAFIGPDGNGEFANIQARGQVAADSDVTAGNAVIAPQITNPSFVPDAVSGHGAAMLQGVDGYATTYTDDLVVRRSMRVAQLQIQKVDCVGGILVVSKAAAEVKSLDLAYANSSGAFAELALNGLDETPNPFLVGDFVRWGTFDRGTASLRTGWAEVVSWSDSDNILTIKMPADFNISGFPKAGDTIVLMGSKNKGRDGFIVISAEDGIENISVYSGVNTNKLPATPRARIGSLDGITDAVFGALSGFGLWSDAAYLRGQLVVKNADGNDTTLSTALTDFRVGLGELKSAIDDTKTGLTSLIQQTADNIKLEIHNDFVAAHPNLCKTPNPRVKGKVKDSVTVAFDNPDDPSGYFHLSKIPVPGTVCTIRVIGKFANRVDFWYGDWSAGKRVNAVGGIDNEAIDCTFTWNKDNAGDMLVVRTFDLMRDIPDHDTFLRSIIFVEADHIPADLAAEDFVENSLYATGIDIRDKRIVATADNFVVRNNKGDETMAIDASGKLSTRLIHVDELEAHKMTCYTGNLKRPIASSLNRYGMGEYIIYHDAVTETVPPDSIDDTSGAGAVMLVQHPHVVFNWDDDTESVIQCYDNRGKLLWTLGNKGFSANVRDVSFMPVYLATDLGQKYLTMARLNPKTYYRLSCNDDSLDDSRLDGVVFTEPASTSARIPDGTYYEPTPSLELMQNTGGNTASGADSATDDSYYRTAYVYKNGRLIATSKIPITA